MTQNLLQGATNTAVGLQGLRQMRNQEQQLLAQQQRQEQERIAQGEAQARINELKAQYGETGDPQVMRQLILADPTIGQEIKTQFDALDTDSKNATLNQAASLKQMLEQNPQQAAVYWEENLSTQPMFAGLADNFQAGDMEGAINEIGWGVTRVGGQQAYDQLFGTPTDDVVAPSSVREWEFYNSLSDDDKKKFINMKRASQIYKEGDVTLEVDPVAGGSTVVTEQGAEVVTQPEAQTRLTEQAAVKQAEIDAAKQAIKLSGEAFGQLESVRSAIPNLDEAMRLVDEGANTGVIVSKLPSVQEASIKLDNLQGRLGLDVIGNTTFGALSESELKFALDTALPKNLEGPALKDWLQAKKDSQTKLAEYLQEAAIYLGTPGNTIAKFLAEKEASKDLTTLSDDDLLNF
jgi:hypothetical protein